MSYSCLKFLNYIFPFAFLQYTIIDTCFSLPAISNFQSNNHLRCNELLQNEVFEVYYIKAKAKQVKSKNCSTNIDTKREQNQFVSQVTLQFHSGEKNVTFLNHSISVFLTKTTSYVN